MGRYGGKHSKVGGGRIRRSVLGKGIHAMGPIDNARNVRNTFFAERPDLLPVFTLFKSRSKVPSGEIARLSKDAINTLIQKGIIKEIRNKNTYALTQTGIFIRDLLREQ